MVSDSNFMLTVRKTVITSIILTICNIAYAGKPTGPKKNACNGALTAAIVTDISFGTFDGGTGGTVTINTNGSRTATAGVNLAGGIISEAHFIVNSSLAGCEIYPVKIRISNNATLTEPGGSTMLANNFTPLPATGFTITPGITQDVFVGGDLTVAAGQASGSYNTFAAPYSITFTH